jgi:Prolyl-tRNA synthetase
VPLRIEIGPRDIKASQVILARRDTLEKFSANMKDLERAVIDTLESIQSNLYLKAERFLKENTRKASNIKELKELLEKKGGIIQVGWCGMRRCEDKIKEETGGKITNLPLQADRFEKCVICNMESKMTANVAKSY